MPHRLEAAKDRPDWLRYAIGAFYALEMILAALGLGQRKSWRGAWSVLVLLVVSTTVVYTFYWSNMRMRTGLAPVVGLLAAAGLCRVFPPWFRNLAGGPGISGAQ